MFELSLSLAKEIDRKIKNNEPVLNSLQNEIHALSSKLHNITSSCDCAHLNSCAICRGETYEAQVIIKKMKIIEEKMKEDGIEWLYNDEVCVIKQFAELSELQRKVLISIKETSDINNRYRENNFWSDTKIVNSQIIFYVVGGL